MIELEKLYDCAEEHLSNKKDWVKFSLTFSEVFRASFALYKGGDAETSIETVATNDPSCVQEFSELRLLGPMPIREASLPLLEPHRITDDIPPEGLRNLGPHYEFMKKNEVFFLMTVPAMMPDGKVLSLTLWRPEDGEDFSDIEKQRLALFMRHLLALVKEPEPAVDNHTVALASFGEKYELTSAELDVLAELLSGQSLREIAARTERSYGTVRWHVRNILSKCHVSSQQNLLREFYALITR